MGVKAGLRSLKQPNKVFKLSHLSKYWNKKMYFIKVWPCYAQNKVLWRKIWIFTKFWTWESYHLRKQDFKTLHQQGMFGHKFPKEIYRKNYLLVNAAWSILTNTKRGLSYYNTSNFCATGVGGKKCKIHF
jgi:hypothetical protein